MDPKPKKKEKTKKPAPRPAKKVQQPIKIIQDDVSFEQSEEDSSDMSQDQTNEKKTLKRGRSSSEDSDVPEWTNEDHILENAENVPLKEIPVEFDVRVMEEIDFKSIRNFLTNYCQNKAFDASELTEIILNQEYLGSVIREASDVESFGFITAINLNFHKEKLCVKQIKDFIITKAPGPEKPKWQQILALTTVGLIINERLINVPAALAPTLHETIYEEIQWALEDGHPFNFDTFIYITSYGHEDKGKEEINWFKPEDAIYFKKAKSTFEVPVNHSETRVIMLFTAKDVPSLLNDMKFTILEEYCW